MTLKEQFEEFKTQFDKSVDDFLKVKVLEGYTINPEAGFNLEEFNKLIKSGGKRVRPAMVHYGSMVFGRTPDQTSNLIGIALEIFHTFALIHDDIIDLSLTRRGVDTMQASYQKKYKRENFDKTKADHLALSAAILGGDYGLIIANQIMMELELDLATKNKINSMYSKMLFELCAGQIDDCIGVGIADFDSISEERINNMLSCKSGNYSIEKPLLLGAILAGASVQKLEILSRIGQKVGLVFQITDDLIGVFGEAEEIGKSNISDITEGKRNLLFAKTYNACNDEEKIKFKSIVGNLEASPSDIEYIKNLMINKNIVNELKSQCQKLIEESKNELLENFESDNQGINFIINLGEYLLVRRS
jgi:geranylgeranyl pyrophosphate synthase